MKLPVSGATYQVHLARHRSDMPDGDAESAGCTDPYAREIHLNVEEHHNKKLSVESTLLHELIHSVLAETGWASWLESVDHKDGIEEGLVSALENGLYQHVQFRSTAVRAFITKAAKEVRKSNEGK